MRRTAGLAAAVAAVAVLALTLAGCAAPKDQGGPDPAMRGQWELIDATDPAGTFVLNNQLISLDIAGDGSTTGRSTCTNYTARIYGTMANLWVTDTLPRAEHCGIQAQQDIEHRYINDLAQVRYSTLTAGVLDLEAPGIDLRYQKALAVPLTLVVDRTWQLSSVAADSYYATTNPTPVNQQGATLRFEKTGVLDGDTGCRIFTANYSENAGEIVVDNFKYRLHGRCNEEEVAADTYVVSVVQAGFTFLSEAGQLVLKSPRAEIEVTLVN